MTRCHQCGRVSYHPKDEETRYCGACHQFYDTMKETETSNPELREKTLGLLMKWRDDFREGASIYKLSEMLFTVAEKQPDAAQFCHDMVNQSEANAKRLEKIIIGYNAPKP